MKYELNIGNLILHRPSNQQGEVYNILTDGFILVNWPEVSHLPTDVLASECVRIKHYKRSWDELTTEQQASAVQQLEHAGDRTPARYQQYKFQVSKEGDVKGWIMGGVF